MFYVGGLQVEKLDHPSAKDFLALSQIHGNKSDEILTWDNIHTVEYLHLLLCNISTKYQLQQKMHLTIINSTITFRKCTSDCIYTD